MNLVDLRAGPSLAHQAGALAICDNTFLSPYFQRPLQFGVDVVMHSTTKYINGHSDVVGGALVTSQPALAEKIGFLQNATGTCAGPQDCYLVLRGIKTLALRMEEHNRTRWRWRTGWSAILRSARCCIPALNRTPSDCLRSGKRHGFGGTFSFRLRGGQPAAFHSAGAGPPVHSRRIAGRRRVADRASRDDDSCFVDPATLERMGITADLIRVSTGIEDIDDLIADLEAALP